MSFPADRDPTPGELRIMFETIMSSLREVKDTMATKEFVNTKFDSHNERMTRLEKDLKAWELESSKNQTAIRAELAEKIRESNEEGISEHREINERIDAILAEKTDLEKSKRARTVSITLAVIAAGLSLAVSLVSAVVINTLIP